MSNNQSVRHIVVHGVVNYPRTGTSTNVQDPGCSECNKQSGNYKCLSIGDNSKHLTVLYICKGCILQWASQIDSIILGLNLVRGNPYGEE